MSSVLKSTDFLEPLGVNDKEADESLFRHLGSVLSTVIDGDENVVFTTKTYDKIVDASNKAFARADEIANTIAEIKQRAEKRRKEIIAMIHEHEAMTKAERDERLMAILNRTCYD